MSIKILSWSKKRMIVSGIILFLLALGALKLRPHIFGGSNPQSEPTHVETIIVKQQPGTERFESAGTIKAYQDIILSSEVSGTIQNLAVSNAEKVQEGTILLNIRHDDILANLKKDQAVFNQKKLYFERLQHLYEKHVVSHESLSEAQSDFQQAKAMIDADQASLDKYIIKAPFAGQIGIWQIDRGQYVKPGDALVSLTALSPAYVDFMLPAKALGKIKIGDDIQFTTASFEHYTWHGKIIAIDPQLDVATRSMRLRGQIDNPDEKLVPRLYGEVVVLKPSTPQLRLPQEAIVYDPQGAFVYVLQKQTATRRQVKLGLHENDDVIVEGGLKPGDEVVTAGMMKLFPGVPVIVNKKIVQ
ncbi:MAG: hypothetical protein A3F12_03895 [Gammaproteobacteria bacterium RIFCSPHIGHO2_12_FULL_38_14]|nr:MAG: hypothetical protein A3F12_03895 [Gammaproteobacteria bacterium RIFCSPHIGHO2_12_FULL_38_14]